MKTLDLLFFSPRNTKVLQAYYFVIEWHTERVNGKQLRRNLLNVVFFAPEHNAMALYHQTFRYKPRMCDINLFVIRLLREAHPRMQERIVSAVGTRFWCTCWEPEF